MNDVLPVILGVVIFTFIWVFPAAMDAALESDEYERLKRQHLRSKTKLTEQEKVRYTRFLWKCAMWPIYLPIYLVCKFFWIIYVALRALYQAIQKAQFFKKLSDIEEK